MHWRPHVTCPTAWATATPHAGRRATGGTVGNVGYGSRRGFVERAAAALTALSLLLVGLAAAPAQAATGDVGFQGPSYSGTYKAATTDKPESKLWYSHGQWWAVMWDTGSGDWHIFRLDRLTDKWVDTDVLVDKRYNTLADVLYVPAAGTTTAKLYVASHIVTMGIAVKGNPARLMRYSYVAGTWKLDAGFPTQIMDYSGESMAIDIDSLGNLWATWTQVATGRTNGAVYVARGAKQGTSWGTPFLVPSADKDGNLPRPDDISSVVSFGKKIGVLWGNQVTSAYYWSVHTDGAADATWSKTVAFKDPGIADDHLNIKALRSDAAGRVYAILKTDYNDFSKVQTLPQVILGTYRGGKWTQTTVWTIADCTTRPLVMINTSTQRLYAMATAPETGCKYSGQQGVIFQKSAPLDNPTFAKGRGTIIMKDADSPYLSDVSGSKGSVNATSGMVLLASNPSNRHYWWSDSLAGS